MSDFEIAKLRLDCLLEARGLSVFPEFYGKTVQVIAEELFDYITQGYRNKHLDNQQNQTS